MDDKRLERAFDGDADAYVELFLEQRRALRAILRYRGCPLDVVDDLLQDIFLSSFQTLVRKPKQRPAPEKFDRWLTRCALNRLTDWWRRQRKDAEAKAQLPQEDAYEDPEPAEGTPPWLVKALGDLSPALRQVVELFYIAELDGKQIADRLEISHAAVKRRLSDARDKLRKAHAAWEASNA